MRPSDETLEKLSLSVLQGNVENVIQDFLSYCGAHVDEFPQATADALFCVFASGLISAMDPSSNWNKKFKAHKGI